RVQGGRVAARGQDPDPSHRKYLPFPRLYDSGPAFTSDGPRVGNSSACFSRVRGMGDGIATGGAATGEDGPCRAAGPGAAPGLVADAAAPGPPRSGCPGAP